ncbi:MAG: GyrI-like domain-containing protein [Planctomycetes bacterium]|nr:GyrI-like domain-containing protein [Planctomycetota bacterium]
MRARMIGRVLAAALAGAAAVSCSGPVPSPEPAAPRPPAVAAPAPATPAVRRGPEGTEILETEALVLAYLEVEGIPYTEMGEGIARVARLLEEQGIPAEGFSRTVYLDDPRAVDTAAYRYRVGFPVARTALPRKPLQREVLEPRLIARARHEGDYDEAYQLRFYERIPAALRAAGYDVVGPITEVYGYPLAQDDPQQWVTEVWYPVRERTAAAPPAAPPAGPDPGKKP